MGARDTTGTAGVRRVGGSLARHGPTKSIGSDPTQRTITAQVEAVSRVGESLARHGPTSRLALTQGTRLYAKNKKKQGNNNPGLPSRPRKKTENETL